MYLLYKGRTLQIPYLKFQCSSCSLHNPSSVSSSSPLHQLALLEGFPVPQGLRLGRSDPRKVCAVICVCDKISTLSPGLPRHCSHLTGSVLYCHGRLRASPQSSNKETGTSFCAPGHGAYLVVSSDIPTSTSTRV